MGRLSGGDGDSPEISRSLSLPLGQWLLLPARRRLGEAALQQAQHDAVSQWVDFAADVEQAWYEAVAAQQVARLRDLVAQAAGHSESLTQRLLEAGNVDRLAHEQERAAASAARIDAARADAAARRARLALASLAGLDYPGEWSLPDVLPAPFAHRPEPEELARIALLQRADLAAVQVDVERRRELLELTSRLRWVGASELELERETEGDASRRGVGISFELPLFDQGQGALEEARSRLRLAEARRDALQRKVHDETRQALDRMRLTQDIAERFRDVLLPAREAIVARTQERVNFMLQGVFELIRVRQQEFDAYQEYLETVRDYWLARSDLRRALGGALPDDGRETLDVLDVDTLLPAAESSRPHHAHDGDGAHAAEAADDAEGGHGSRDAQPEGHDHHDHHQHHRRDEVPPNPSHRDGRHPNPTDAAPAPTAATGDAGHDTHGDHP